MLSLEGRRRVQVRKTDGAFRGPFRPRREALSCALETQPAPLIRWYPPTGVGSPFFSSAWARALRRQARTLRAKPGHIAPISVVRGELPFVVAAQIIVKRLRALVAGLAFGSSSILAAIPLCAMATLGCESVAPPVPLRQNILAVVLDQSRSCVHARCPELGERVRGELKQSASALSIIAFATGGRSGEPTILVDRVFQADPADVFRGPQAVEKRKRDFIALVLKDCSAINAENYSPIVAAGFRANEVLISRCQQLEERGQKCGSKKIALHTDGRDNDARMPEIARALRSPTDKHIAALKPILVAPDVLVEICGTADSNTAMTTPEAVGSVYRRLFGPKTIIDPACPRGDNATATKSASTEKSE